MAGNRPPTPQALGTLTNIWQGRSQFTDPYPDSRMDGIRIYKKAMGAEMISKNLATGPMIHTNR